MCVATLVLSPLPDVVFYLIGVPRQQRVSRTYASSIINPVQLSAGAVYGALAIVWTNKLGLTHKRAAEQLTVVGSGVAPLPSEQGALGRG